MAELPGLLARSQARTVLDPTAPVPMAPTAPVPKAPTAPVPMAPTVLARMARMALAQTPLALPVAPAPAPTKLDLKAQTPTATTAPALVQVAPPRKWDQSLRPARQALSLLRQLKLLRRRDLRLV